jgi:hypothetical protein
MATMAFPIRELELSVSVGTGKARAETECVVFYSQARAISPGIATTLKFVCAATLMKLMLSSLARNQRLLISAYQKIDFTRYGNEELGKAAASLERIIECGRPVLEKLGEFGPRAQRLWGSSLSQLAEQLDHFESIAASLRVAADPEASLLLGLAVRQMAAD